MGEKKIFKKYIKPALAIIAVILLVTGIITIILPGYTVLITDIDSNHFRGKILFLTGNTLICLRDREDHRTRKEALLIPDPDYKPAFIPVNRINHIEIIHQNTGEDQPTEAGIPGKYLGGYRITASGHRGILNLFVSKGKFYGSVKFPGWANGVWEPLKYPRIRGNRLYFTRSVTTLKELRRIGASEYFTQQYRGTYSRNGKKIKGFYTVKGARNQWEAVRIR